MRWAESTWNMMVDSAFLFLIGLTLAGFLYLILNEKILKRLTSGSPLSTVFKSAAIGIPLPLCSCSVLPVASQLRASGVARGGVMAFLVATPETGVDSIILTYALADPVMTVARPVAAWLTAMTSGLSEEILFTEREKTISKAELVTPAEECCDDCHCASPVKVEKRSLLGSLVFGVRYAYTTLLSDLAPYLVVGFLLAGLVGAILGPDSAIPKAISSGWVAYAWAIGIGVPLYVCATSSTPLAAALLAAGFSPGAILVFLLVGPATNITSIVVLKRILGTWPTVRFLVSVVVVATLCGLGLDLLYHATGWQVKLVHHGAKAGKSWVQLIAAGALCLAIVYYSGLKIVRRWF